MIRILLTLLALTSALPAAAASARPPASATVTVTRQADRFIAEFRLPRAAPAWGFFRSSTALDGKPWRARSWTVLTPGVKLERHGNIDALIGTAGPMPAVVRVAMTPFTDPLTADYVNAIRIGRGVGLFDGHFAVFSVNRVEALDTLSPNPGGPTIVDGGTRVRFTGSNLRVAGDVKGYQAASSSGAYGLYGVPVASVSDGVATVIDPALPRWLAADLTAFAPRVIGSLTSRLGPAGLDHPTIVAAWEGVADPGASMNGGALSGLIMMRFSGAKAVTPLPKLKSMARWFIAHEASHFWLGQTVGYAGPHDNWMMEGGADLLAVRTVKTLDPAFDARAELNRGLADCTRFARQPVASAGDRGEHRALYACGAVFSMVAEKAAGGSFDTFVRSLISATRDSGKASTDDWLLLLDRTSGKPALGRSIRSLLDHGSADPAGAIDRLLTLAAIAHQRGPDGAPQL